MRRRVTTLMMATTVVVLALCTAPVEATVQLRLSDYASDSEDPSVFDATMDFTVGEVGGQFQLELIVDNLTPETGGDIALRIDEIYFNGKDNITGLVLIGVSEGNIDKWVWDFMQGGDGASHQVNNFGRFDMYVKDAPTDNPKTFIDAGSSLTFTFDIAWTGTSPVDTDFIELSTQVDGHNVMLAAAKFYDGGFSGFGAVPEPATVALLGLGALALLRKRRP